MVGKRTGVFSVTLMLLCATGVCVSDAEVENELAEEIQRLDNGKTCTNLEEVMASVDFSNPDADPYPHLWYDTIIERSRNCYVEYSDQERMNYRLLSLLPDEAQHHDGIILTHKGPCGVCSQLQDLAVYLRYPDLTTPVRACSLKLLASQRKACLRALGFTNECSMIWYWNAYNTRKPKLVGGCFSTCMRRIFTPNNVPSGTYNPCEPLTRITDQQRINEDTMRRHAQQSESELTQGPEDAVLPLDQKGAVSTMQRRSRNRGHCGNTINGKPACSEQQWKDGPFRINACLQCDECRSGPIFQKVAGRTRRASGIESAISRHDFTDIIRHDYG